MGFKLSDRSLQKLDLVHPDLVKIVLKAAELSSVEFIITEGKRSLERQKELKAAGASKTLDSRHLVQPCGYACAVDLAAKVGEEVRWDWPLYAKLAAVMKLAASSLNLPIEWGGDWKSFKDGPHFQLPKNDPRYASK